MLLMPNKTIYIKDETLWQNAKKFAGKGGLSEVIADALRRFVADSEAKAAGQETFRFVVQFRGDDDFARVAFRGRLLESKDLDSGSLNASVYETQGGSFVLVLGEEGPYNVSFHYAKYETLKEIAQDSELLELLRSESDAVSWINDVAIKRAEEASAEIWID